jgi:hypothetical protein
LVPSAFDEIKAAEDIRIKAMEEKYEQDMKTMRQEMNHKFSQIMSMIQYNPKLSNIKAEVLLSKETNE